MKHINHLSFRNNKKSSRQQPAQIGEEQKEAVNYFYSHLKAIYSSEYDRHFIETKMIDASKREWALNIVRYSKEEIDAGIEWIKTQKINCEDGWQFMDIGRCIGAIKSAQKAERQRKDSETTNCKRLYSDSDKAKKKQQYKQGLAALKNAIK